MRLTLFILFLTTATLTFGQVIDPEFGAVEKKFDKGNFESALEGADALIDNDKHRKKPEPYLWASMCYLEIHRSDDEKLAERFKSALRDALKYAGKAYSKDKSGDFVKKHSEYFSEMKKEGISLAQSYEREEDYRKAQYTYKQLLKFAPEDAFIQFAKGVMDVRLSSLYEAEREISESFPVLESNYRNLDYVPDPISSVLLKPAVVYYADHLIENNYVDSARTVLLSARVFFPLDNELKEKLEGL